MRGGRPVAVLHVGLEGGPACGGGGPVAAGGVDLTFARGLVGLPARSEAPLLVVLAVGAEVAGGEAAGAILELVLTHVGQRGLPTLDPAIVPYWCPKW